MKKCPVDGTNLETELYERTVEMDVCPACEGLWLDPRELEAIQETIINDYSSEFGKIPDYVDGAMNLIKAESEEVYQCPACSKALEKKEYGYCSQIMIDTCPSGCGVWLHNGELQELEVFFEKCREEANGDKDNVVVVFFNSLKSLFD